MTRSGFKLAAVGSLAALIGLFPMAPIGHAESAAPKAYVGLFGDSSVGVIDTSTNTLVKTIAIPAGPHGLVITPDGKWVYASSDGDSKVSVIDTARDEVTASLEAGATPHGLAITPNGSRVLVAGFGTNQVEAIDTGTNKTVWQTPVPQPHNIAITADGLTAYVASQKQDSPSLAIIDIANGTQTATVPLDRAPRALSVSPDGQEVFFTQAGVDSVQVLDRTTNQIVTQIPSGASPHHPFFTPNGKLGLVVAQGPGEMDVFDPDSYSATGTIKVGDMPHWIAVTSDSHFAYVSNEKSSDVSVVDLTTSSVTATIAVGTAPRKIVVQSATPAVAPTASVSISKFAFVPATLTVTRGQSVTWTNADAVEHTATGDAPSSWDSGSIDPNATFSMTFNEAGTYAYHCDIHPFMRGTIIVK